jgi:hypothetical protein
MSGQSTKKDYTLEQIQGIRTRWISRETFGGMLQSYQRAVQAKTGKIKRFYERLFSPLVTLDLMVYQRLHADHSLDAAVNTFISSQPEERRKGISESTSAYCQARQRLPWDVVKASLCQAAQGLREEIGEEALWNGRQVCLLDGSTLRLEASQELHDHYGVSSNHYGENHWPLMRVLATFDLFTGGLEGAVEAPYNVGELSMLKSLMEAADPGWVWVGDMNFGCYRTAQIAQEYQQDIVVRMRSDRVKRWIDKQPLASGEDRAVVWEVLDKRRLEEGLPAPAIAGRLIYLRVEQPGFRPFDLYLFTTLTDPVQFPTQAILKLYNRRWNVELNLRHLKTTLEMEDLHGKSVDLVRKEFWVGLLAYTLIRGIMGLAALHAKLSPLGLSFARCLRRIRSTCISHESPSTAWQSLFDRLAACRLPVRKKARVEPRQVWGKPRVFPTIKGSRDLARANEVAKYAQPIS